MTSIDYIILFTVTTAIVAAIYFSFHRRKRVGGCCGCDSCDCGCARKKTK